MCGAQVLSHRSSGPSFSFGSGPQRLDVKGDASSGKGGTVTLQASVSATTSASPGPIYNPAPSRKWLGDAPRAQFGTQKQRPDGFAATQDISKLTGKSNLPGPGTYKLPAAVGKQPLGRCHSNPHFSFGQAKQRESAALVTPSPGPVYDPKGTVRGTSNGSSYSFGNDIRTKNRDPSARVPGPGVYNLRSAMGHQPLSMYKSAMHIGFGTPSLGGSGRSAPLEGRHSPGPIYMAAGGCRKQVHTCAPASLPRRSHARAHARAHAHAHAHTLHCAGRR
jgi:hypothetical protein